MSASVDRSRPTFRIRRARAADAGPIARVHVAAWRESYAGLIPGEVLDNLSWRRRRRMWTQSLSGGQGRGAVFVAEREGDLVGFAAAGPSRDEGEDPAHQASLFAIYLLEQVKGRGLGRDLVEATLEPLRMNAFDTISLWVLEANTKARGFYEATGWRVDGGGKECFGLDHVVELPTIRYRREL